MSELTTQTDQDIVSLKEPMALGVVFAESGMFPDAKTQSQAVVKILAGREIGLTPFQSMKSLYMVNGRLGMMTDVMANLIKKNEKYDYTVDKLCEEECVLSFYLLNGERTKIGESSFTSKDAAKAGLINKEVWKSYPRNMLFSRALSNGVRWYCPDAVCGYYTVEEIEHLNNPIKPVTVELTTEGEVKNGEA